MNPCVPPTVDDNTSGMAPALVLDPVAKWSKTNLTYAYFPYDNQVIAMVDSAIQGPQFWTNFCGITAKRVDSLEDADIRMEFIPGGSWSYVGNGSEFRAKNESSMNFGWFYRDTKYEEILRVTLHEWGHALGFWHEHDSYLQNIKWNKEAVYSAYASSHGWSKDEVDMNVFKVTEIPGLIQLEYDPESIMHYGVNQDWLDPSETRKIGGNGRLSDGDKKYARTWYGAPKREHKNTYLPLIFDK
jgi:serralysin